MHQNIRFQRRTFCCFGQLASLPKLFENSSCHKIPSGATAITGQSHKLPRINVPSTLHSVLKRFSVTDYTHAFVVVYASACPPSDATMIHVSFSHSLLKISAIFLFELSFSSQKQFHFARLLGLARETHESYRKWVAWRGKRLPGSTYSSVERISPSSCVILNYVGCGATTLSDLDVFPKQRQLAEIKLFTKRLDVFVEARTLVERNGVQEAKQKTPYSIAQNCKRRLIRTDCMNLCTLTIDCKFSF